MNSGKANLVAEEELCPGTAVVIAEASPSSKYSVVFEDDGETGYLYGVGHADSKMQILDALHIYNVSQITDRDIPSLFQIFWSDDGLKAVLLINQYPHAVFDFSESRGYCRNNFPPANPNFSKHSHEWDDAVLKFF